MYAQELSILISTLSPATCTSDAMIAVYGNNGVGPYQYSVDNGATYQSSTMFVLPSGTYYVTVRDAAMTVVGQSFTINPPAPVYVSISGTMMISCAGNNNGMITATASGGQGNYTYTLLNSADVVIVAPSSSSTFAGLPAGSYKVMVTDSSGCLAVSPNFSIIELPPMTATAVLDPNQNTVTVTALGGSFPYSFSVNGGPFQASGIFSNLTMPGVYTFLVRDSSGCSVVTNSITINNNHLHLTANGTYVDYNNDGSTNVGDIITYQFTVSNSGSLPVTNVVLSELGLSVSGGPIASLAPGASDNSTFTATHVITQQNINFGSVLFDVIAIGTYTGNTISETQTVTTSLSISDGIKLNAFLDANSNGIQDGAEQNFTFGNFNYVLNDDGIVHHIASSTGTHYIYDSNPANSFDVNLTIDANYASQYTITTSSYNNITIPAGSGIVTYNFPVTVLPFNDLSVTVLPYYGVLPRPGFTYTNQVVYRNNGNQTIASGTLTYTKDNAVSILSVFPSGTITPTGFTYDFVNLVAGEERTVFVEMQVPVIPMVQIGGLLTNTASITAPAGDINLLNNNSSLTQIIVGSYDPNDKVESHGGKILHSTFTSNDYLTYTIQFENTGTANAVNVRISDVLDAQLDETTVKTISASHGYTLDRVGNNLNWKFNGIELPPSVADTTTGKGYVSFQVKPKPGYAVGDIIPNTASIFFDFNPAIVTNTFDTEFVAALFTAQFESDAFTVYPNPTAGLLTISFKENTGRIHAVEVNDVLGKTVLVKTIQASTATIDLSPLTKGIYFVKVLSDGLEKVKVMKVVRQ